MSPPPALRFVVPGPPVAKARGRTVTTPGGEGITYTPGKTRRYEQLVAFKALAAVMSTAGWRTDWASYALKVTAYREVARGDASNIAKSIEDGMNKIAYVDDLAVKDLHVVLVDGDPVPRVEVELSMVGELSRVMTSRIRSRRQKTEALPPRFRRR